jgi:hypothetical protein
MDSHWRNGNLEPRGQVNELDLQVDAALAKYTSVEPMAGLDDRILANLRAERAQVPERAWWRWAVAGALATVAVVALTLAWRSGKSSLPVVADHSSAATQASKEPATQVISSGRVVSNGDANQRLHAFNPARRRTINPVRREPIVAANSPELCCGVPGKSRADRACHKRSIAARSRRDEDEGPRL